MTNLIKIASNLIFMVLSIQLSETCTCVPVNLCRYEGESVINLRGPNTCGNYWYICCDEEDIISDSDHKPNTPWEKKCGVSHPKGLPGYHLINNENYSQYGEFPWVIAVLKKDFDSQLFKYFRGGSLIHPSVVLTGSFRLENLDKTEIIIRAGEYDSFNTEEPYPHQDRQLSAIERHNSSNRPQFTNNIALLFLVAPLNLNINVGTVLLPQQNNVVELVNCIATGWGATEFEQSTTYSRFLKRIELPIVEHDRCELLLRRAFNKPKFHLSLTELCAGGIANVDTCFGDGGSPLVCPVEGNKNIFYQAGLVSSGVGCGYPDVPSVYTNIASYRNWIDKKLEDYGFTAIDCDVVDAPPRMVN